MGGIFPLLRFVEHFYNNSNCSLLNGLKLCGAELFSIVKLEEFLVTTPYLVI